MTPQCDICAAQLGTSQGAITVRSTLGPCVGTCCARASKTVGRCLPLPRLGQFNGTTKGKSPWPGVCQLGPSRLSSWGHSIPYWSGVATSPRTQNPPLVFDQEALCASAHSLVLFILSFAHHSLIQWYSHCSSTFPCHTTPFQPHHEALHRPNPRAPAHRGMLCEDPFYCTPDIYIPHLQDAN